MAQSQVLPDSSFLPMTRPEMAARGWEELDILFVSGDAYIDHPAFGIPLLARYLESLGYRVGIIAQPDWRNRSAFQVMGRPRLFAAVSSGAMDSMVNHYTAARRPRRDDAYTPGGCSGLRPNRAVIAYTSALKGAFKGLPVVIGGIEASLRRLAHYDYWTDAVRRSVLVDSKADLLVYGMGELALAEIARRMNAGESFSALQDVAGTAFLQSEEALGCELPSYEAVASDVEAYNRAFRLAAEQTFSEAGQRISQRHSERWVTVNSPSRPLREDELDAIYDLPFTRLPHPGYLEPIPAYTQIRFSITTHRGCFGGCAFCAITHHQGKVIQSRSEGSVLTEIDRLAAHPEFRGTITDVGGPTANMYGLSCGDPGARRRCRRASCLFPAPCRHLNKSDKRAVRLLRRVRQHRKVKHAFVASGIRFDLLAHQQEYFEELLTHHVGGLLKVAPESVSEGVTSIMRKPGPKPFVDFLEQFWAFGRQNGRRQGVVPYFISSHPGCTLSDMVDVALFLCRHRLKVEQVQEFTPTPGTLSTCMYYTGRDPFTGQTVHVPRTQKEKKLQKALLLYHLPESRADVVEALRASRRQDAAKDLLGDNGKQRPSPRSRKVRTPL